MNIHDEGVALRAYLKAAGRWEALEWDRVYAWMDAVVAHHAVVADAAPAVEHVVLETLAAETPAEPPSIVI
jgi:hypothetical protein